MNNDKMKQNSFNIFYHKKNTKKITLLLGSLVYISCILYFSFIMERFIFTNRKHKYIYFKINMYDYLKLYNVLN